MGRSFRYIVILVLFALGTGLAAVAGWRYARTSAPVSGPIQTGLDFDFEAELKIVIARKCRDKVPPSLLDRVSKALAEASRPGVGAEDSGGMSNL